MIEEALIGRTSAFSDKEEIEASPLAGCDIDLGRQVGAGVTLRPHIQRRELRVAEIILRVSLVNAERERLGIVGTTRPNLLTFLSNNLGCAGILAKR